MRYDAIIITCTQKLADIANLAYRTEPKTGSKKHRRCTSTTQRRRQTDCNIAAGCVRKPRWFFPPATPAAPAALAMLASPGFPCVSVTSPRPVLLPRGISQARQTDHRCFPVWRFRSHRTDRRTEGKTDGRQTVAYPLSARRTQPAAISRC